VAHGRSTSTPLCGDLFTAVGNSAALVESERVGPAMAAEDVFSATCLTPATGRTLRRLADFTPSTLGVMHGPSFSGNGTEQLTELAH
jgi:hypothetical protein